MDDASTLKRRIEIKVKNVDMAPWEDMIRLGKMVHSFFLFYLALRPVVALPLDRSTA